MGFAPPSTQPSDREYLVARSRGQVVTPHVALTTPKAPASADHDDLITAAGDLTPRHSTGQHTVRLVFQRRGAGGELGDEAHRGRRQSPVRRLERHEVRGSRPPRARVLRVQAVHPQTTLTPRPAAAGAASAE